MIPLFSRKISKTEASAGIFLGFCFIFVEMFHIFDNFQDLPYYLPLFLIPFIAWLIFRFAFMDKKCVITDKRLIVYKNKKIVEVFTKDFINELNLKKNKSPFNENKGNLVLTSVSPVKKARSSQPYIPSVPAKLKEVQHLNFVGIHDVDKLERIILETFKDKN